MQPTILAERVLSGDRRALARLITQLENDAPSAREALAALWPHTGRAHVVGVTGAPGTGKSTLVNALAKHLRISNPQSSISIIAVDPTSPFTGGAILGDRIRMRDLAGDPGIFIRSMATRGSLGGISRATSDAVKALDAAGFDTILIETVGAGQSEVEIARTAHTVIVVEAPGLGDDVQAIKAGILEIADILVVNKADQPGAEAAVKTLRVMLELGGRRQGARGRGQSVLDMGHHAGERIGNGGDGSTADEKRPQMQTETPVSAPVGAPSGRDVSGRDPADRTHEAWEIPILQTIAPEGKGIAEVADAIARHRAHLQASGELAVRERDRVADELRNLLRDTLLAQLMADLGNGQFAAAVERVLVRQSDPRSEVDGIIRLAGSERHREV